MIFDASSNIDPFFFTQDKPRFVCVRLDFALVIGIL